ncbi:MAG: cobyric acid synthase [Lachnospiraceae bacterium]|nr:cobyric acid synthase [Lachnospiraceae bacterium]
MAKCIMIQGTMSGAGKSLLVTALCRIFRQDGFRVAPFKSQNMALNSCITRDGLEMGRAQAAQAEAAGKEPDVRMNPILLKPTSDAGSQVIVNGRVLGTYRARDYFQMKKSLIPDILAAYKSLAAENDIIVIEGAGSPAEINLKADDIVNMGLAKMVDAPVLLVGDIDPGGVFAQLYGTIALLEEDERARIAGTIINKFRGDPEILRPGLGMLEELTNVPCLGVVPYMDVDIDDEDSLSSRLGTGRHEKAIDIAVIRLPRISNFTDFSPLEEHPALGVRYVKSRRELGTPDMVILPGTKNTMEDLKWLRECGLEAMILKLAEKGNPILGVCGGYQMLGMSLADPLGVESGNHDLGWTEKNRFDRNCFNGGRKDADLNEKTGRLQAHSALHSYDWKDMDLDEGRLKNVEAVRGGVAKKMMPGMGLLPVMTEFAGDKRRTRIRGYVANGPLAGAKIDGYEIHMGRTNIRRIDKNHIFRLQDAERFSGQTDMRSVGQDFSKCLPFICLEDGTWDGCQIGNIFGTYLHGLFDTGELTNALASFLMKRKGINPDYFRAESRAEYRERQYEKLAALVRKNLDIGKIYSILE